ncbi:MAG: tRNA (adenosine(37)-N6)-threonylcarbamoyltransferase complex ATPase subunit type 1 TsaE [Pelotomaculum sp.]|uniref:tRNA threonylcarbamoyladenosine biosynthesis protein TsaE n=1 Tax=Pelotomaculum thermopropionicum (strain DSM 13744 / JCM 10971 / SI) TaxID=370438 RepID=A5D4C1_PELTS|nr:tRNA (adenosine(37)-N6)-threonylcarbamoyltransferase complex ATPase subunit type 1 TsaE [Pelotomaculum sp.]BAF58922.1 predicted ATPase or kinase [Pelotomaculum thermopropionicum SI]
MPVIKTFSPEETAGVGEKLAALLRPGDVICLNGDLGAGKTRLAQGVARGLGIEGPVTSPTFTLINEYQGGLTLYHIDVYRLDSPAEMEDLGCAEYFYGEGVTLVEWADKVKDLLPGERLDIYIKRSPEGEDVREIIAVPRGERYRYLAEELTKVVRAGD